MSAANFWIAAGVVAVCGGPGFLIVFGGALHALAVLIGGA